MQPADTPTSSASRQSLVLVAVAAAVLVALAVAVLVLDLRHHSSYQQQGAERQAALNVAQQEALNFSSLDYHNLTQSFANVTKLADANFTQSFNNQTNGIAEQIIKAKGKSSGTLRSAAVQNISSTAAQVLVAVDVTSTNVQAPKGITNGFRMVIKLVRQHQQWLVDAVNQQ